MIVEIEFGTPAYDEAVRLRDEVLRQPLGLVFTPEQLAEEYNQTHLGFYDDSTFRLQGVLTLQWTEGGEVVKMRQVAVAPDLQGRGIGRRLVAFSEAFAQGRGYSHITLHARKAAVPFYEKLGYQTVGEEFVEVGIAHFEMGKEV